MTTLHMNLGERGYDIHIGRSLLDKAGEIFNLKRRVFIVTDSGVPSEYAKIVAAFAKVAKIVTVPEGEGSKSLAVYGRLLTEMAEFGLTRTDCAVAVGGGVVGDLTGFLAASYMRGIDFYNIPTTVLSQVDSSIGGKTAINLAGIKNIVGAFHQPKGVIIDTNTLSTLPKRQVANGLAEALKMSMTSDSELFSLFENEEIDENNIEKVITSALKIKKAVVEEDERESSVRKILNFGHTFGHAVEAEEEMHGFYHGECVAIGMLPVCSQNVRERLLTILKKLGLPYLYGGDIEKALTFISHDKKCDGDKINIVLVNEIGSYEIKKMTVSDFCEMVRNTAFS
ncbi:MAG: 3-dehydroquinate synthase [Clostridia bacterium]|nr:3-dehydroquinate synthase [Clostridia bacterium]